MGSEYASNIRFHCFILRFIIELPTQHITLVFRINSGAKRLSFVFLLLVFLTNTYIFRCYLKLIKILSSTLNLDPEQINGIYKI